MGSSVLGNTEDYWKSVYEQHSITDTFPRDRFLALIQYFHLADNSLYDPTAPSRLHKIQPLIDIVTQQSRLCHYPSQYVTVDGEMLMKELVGSFSARKKRGRPYAIWGRPGMAVRSAM